jgi:hypothetical protein
MKRFLSILLAWSSFCLCSALSQTVMVEDFSTDPLQSGWKMAGDTNLFQWDATNQNLRVTWDSSQPNSYFYHPLPTILTRSDDFSLAFDLRLETIGPGLDPAKNATFQIAIGFQNSDLAAGTNFLRGTGRTSPDLVEFDYFWDSGFGATVWPTLVDTNSVFNYTGAKDYAILVLTPGDEYHLLMAFTASNQTMVTTLTNLNASTGLRITQLLTTNFTDFRLTALSVSSYSDVGQATAFAGSVLAHGVIDNIVTMVPDPPLQNLTAAFRQGVCQVQFEQRAQWIYTLQRSTDFRSWTDLLPSAIGTNGSMILADNQPSLTNSFYRVRADRP